MNVSKLTAGKWLRYTMGIMTSIHGEKSVHRWPMKRPLMMGFLNTAAENSMFGLIAEARSQTSRAKRLIASCRNV